MSGRCGKAAAHTYRSVSAESNGHAHAIAGQPPSSFAAAFLCCRIAIAGVLSSTRVTACLRRLVCWQSPRKVAKPIGGCHATHRQQS